MRYFTPQLFEECNSDNESVMLKSHRKWDDAIERYRTQRSVWIDAAPSGVKKLASRFCGHDGVVAANGKLADSFFYLFFVSESGAESVICYQLLSEPVATRHESDARCWSDQPLWLYDEISRTGARKYRHEILFGDGRILQIDFSDVAIRTWPGHKTKNGARRPRVGLTMPDPAARVSTLSAAMKLWSASRPAARQRSKPAAKRRPMSMARSA